MEIGSINKDAMQKHGLTEHEVIALIVASQEFDIIEVLKGLELKGLASRKIALFSVSESEYFATRNGISILSSLILDSDKSLPKDNDLKELARKLKETFPKGKNMKCNMYWSEGEALIIKRLKTFFKKYGEFSHEDIIFAAESYIESFNGNYEYTQLLKYFIFKDQKGAEGTIENTSTLLTMIENKEEILQAKAEGTNYDWRTSLL